MDEQRIIELRDSLLPSQGEPFDCVAFARLVIAEALRAERERAMVCVPSNWCDPLLTGPTGIGQPPYNCNHVEQLLRGIRDAIRAMGDSEK